MRSAFASAFVAAAAIAGVILLEAFAAPEAHVAATAKAAPAGVPRTYGEALARIDEAVADAARRGRERPGEWLVHEATGRAYLSRAKLTGSFADYAEAERALRKAFEESDPGVGPHMSAALLHFSVHRLDAAAAMLDRVEAYAVPPTGSDRAELLAMRGDIAFYKGNYAEAMRLYRDSDAIAPGAADFRLAVFHSKTGNSGRADFYLARAAERERGAQPRAFLELHRGVLDLDGGRLDEALAHFRRAERMLGGFWLVEEHIAEVEALRGNTAGAARIYRHVVAKTGHPEFMDRLADLAASRGQDAAAAHWRGRAWREWQRRLRLFPEAAYGHALDHCISKGDRTCALKLAAMNVRARPYGEARLKLAEALLMNNRREEAKLVLAVVARSGWDPASSTEMLRTLHATR